MKKVILILIVSFNMSSYACTRSKIELNNNAWLYGNGFLSGTDRYEIKDLKEHGYIGILLDVSDKDSNRTHEMMVLGYDADDQGVLSTTYLIKDVKSGEEKVLLLKTNYAGNGSWKKGLSKKMDQTTPDEYFKSLSHAGCH